MSFPRCEFCGNNGDDVRLHRFPRRQSKAQMWAKSLNWERQYKLIMKFKKCLHLCSDHFTLNHYHNGRLSADAVPRRHVPAHLRISNLAIIPDEAMNPPPQIKVETENPDPLRDPNTSSALSPVRTRKMRIEEKDAIDPDVPEMRAVVLMGLSPDAVDVKPSASARKILSLSPPAIISGKTEDAHTPNEPQQEYVDNGASLRNLSSSYNNGVLPHFPQSDSKNSIDLLSGYIDNSFIAMANLAKLRLASSENAVKVIRKIQTLLDEELNKYSSE